MVDSVRCLSDNCAVHPEPFTSAGALTAALVDGHGWSPGTALIKARAAFPAEPFDREAYRLRVKPPHPDAPKNSEKLSRDRDLGAKPRDETRRAIAAADVGPISREESSMGKHVVGSPMKCEGCGKTVKRTHSRQKFCRECAKCPVCGYGSGLHSQNCKRREKKKAPEAAETAAVERRHPTRRERGESLIGGLPPRTRVEVEESAGERRHRTFTLFFDFKKVEQIVEAALRQAFE